MQSQTRPSGYLLSVQSKGNTLNCSNNVSRVGTHFCMFIQQNYSCKIYIYICSRPSQRVIYTAVRAALKRSQLKLFTIPQFRRLAIIIQ